MDSTIMVIAVVGLLAVLAVSYFMVASRPPPKSDMSQIIESIVPFAPLVFG